VTKFGTVLFLSWLTLQTNAMAAPQQTTTPQPAVGQQKQEEMPLASAPAGTPVRRETIPTPEDRSYDHEDWGIQLDIQYLVVRATGNVTTLSTPATISGDLGINGLKSVPYFRLAFKPSRKHEVIFDTAPYQLNGASTVTTPLVFHGQTFDISQPIQSKIDVISANVAYQYDVVSRPNGFAGLSAGVGYLDGLVKVTDLTNEVAHSERERAAFPLLGFAFRAYPCVNVINCSGEVKGMRLANYGYTVQSAFAMGYSPTHNLTLKLGYQMFDTDVHDKTASKGVRTKIYGAVLGLQLRNQ